MDVIFLAAVLLLLHLLTRHPGGGVPELDNMDPNQDAEPSAGDAIEIEERRRG